MDTRPQSDEVLGTTKTGVTVYAFDPETVNGERAMSFRTRTGELFRPYPMAEYYRSGTSQGYIAFSTKHPKSSSLFVDDCLPQTKSGNSGALITETGNLKKIHGVYDGKAEGFLPGGISIHNCMSAHGPDLATYEKASSVELKPHKIQDTLAFMWESRYVFRPTKFALGAPQLQKDYDKVWDGFKKTFK